MQEGMKHLSQREACAHPALLWGLCVLSFIPVHAVGFLKHLTVCRVQGAV